MISSSRISRIFMLSAIARNLRWTMAVALALCLTGCGEEGLGDAEVTAPEPEAPAAISCPVGSPPGLPVAQGLLENLTQTLNQKWPDAAEQIDPVATEKTTVDDIDEDPLGSGACTTGQVIHGGNGETAQVYCETEHGMTCDEVYANVHLDSLAGLSRLQFALAPSTVEKNVAAHSSPGPDASKLTDGVFAPAGSSATDPAYAIVLPHANEPDGALVIDLGDSVSICGNGYQCIGEPKLQADNDDYYQLDYSADGVSWITYGVFSKVSDSGLQTRTFQCSTRPDPSKPCSSTNHGANFTARYVRVFGTAGGPTYAVSELMLWNAGSQLISVGKPVVGPRPYQITDGLAPEKSSATNTQYAVVLNHDTGSAPALAIDLGEVKTICGNKYQCIGEPEIQADNDDVYQFDYSTDGVNWITYEGTFPSVAPSSSGLHTRDMSCSARPDLDSDCSETNHGPNFEARYVRVYAVSGGPTFAVSELRLWDTSGKLVSDGALTSGPEPLVTNGELAPDGADWNDRRYATVLPRCNSTNSVCPAPSSPPTSPALTSALLIDLTASFPIDSLTIQADRHQFQVDSSTNGTSWTPLWTFGTRSGSGLITRNSDKLGGPQARYLRVYGTAGDDNNYSVSELQVFTAQAKTACMYDSAANAGKNFTCGFDGESSTRAILPDRTTDDAPVLNVTFHVDEVALKVTCGGIPGVDPTHWTLQSATNRNCSLDLEVAEDDDGKTDLTGEFCAGSCASGSSLLSLYTNTKDLEFTAVPGSLVCDGGDLDDNIPQILEGFVAKVAGGASQSLLAGILDYHNKPNSLVPFPPNPGMCAAP